MNHLNHHSQDTSHAVVVGGSVAGLLTARVLTNFFGTVTVIERDSLPDRPAFRKGAPQARHGHGLLIRGQQIMDELFPGFSRGLLQNGAVQANMGSDTALFLKGRRMRSFQSALAPIACSRALIEHQLYSMLREYPQVQFRQQCTVIAIQTDPERQRAVGIHLEDRSGTSPRKEALNASLIVDASGRGSRMPQWLESVGYTPPSERVVDAKAGYASRIVRRTEFSPDWKILYYLPNAPECSRGGIMVPMEPINADGSVEKRWIATLIGLNGDHPPTDEEGFLDFARSLPTPILYNTLVKSQPLSQPYGFRRASNRLREYDKLPRYLEGLLAIGDSVYALNPTYGQGMTVAALSAKVLDKTLRSHQQRHGLENLDGLAQQFQRALAKVNAGPWQLATGQDLLWPVANEGYQPSIPERLIQGYFSAVMDALLDDSVVAEAFVHVQNMMKSPASLFHPGVVFRVLRQALRNDAPDQPNRAIDTYAEELFEI